MKSDRLTLSGLRFFARHGALPEEAARGQDFEVTVRLELPLAEAGRSDDLGRTIDYRAAQEAVAAIMAGPRRHLVEALAESIAAELLRRFPSLRAVDVEVVKLRPPVSFTCSGLAVRIRRERPKA